MIAAFDVHYPASGGGSAAAVIFCDYGDPEPAAEHALFLPEAAAYVPGEFYRRELPCILALISQIPSPLDELVIDGYVMLGERPGLGQWLFLSLDGKIPVIGVAKTLFRGSSGVPLFRGKSVRPLYVTSAGVEPEEACERIRRMHGLHRVPTLLKRVDLLAREHAERLRCQGGTP